VIKLNNKGAIEFSMTAIMVIIIGVAVLALGLAWVRGTFSQVGTITDVALQNAETVFGQVGFTGKLGTPATILMDESDAKRYKVHLRNIESNPVTLNVKASLSTTISTTGCDIKLIPDGAIADNVLISEGDTISLGGGVLVNNCTKQDSAVIRIDVTKPVEELGAPPAYASEAIAIQIQS